MSEFKLTGDLYVSEWNGDSLNDGSALTPYAHTDDALDSDSIIIIGSGNYNGASLNRCKKWGDGEVVLNLLGNPYYGYGYNNNTSASPSAKNLNIRNCSLWYPDYGSSNRVTYFMDSIIELETYEVGYRGYISVIRCIFKALGSSMVSKNSTKSNQSPFRFYNCIFLCDFSFVATYGNAGSYLHNCYIPKTVTVEWYIIHVTSIFQRNNLINGKILYQGIIYELKQLIDGSPRPDADPLIPDFIDVYPDIYNYGNFASVNTKIIDIENRVVEPDSDLLKKGDGNGYIGGVHPARNITVNSVSSDVTVETLRIDTTNPSDFIIDAAEDDGEITITWKTDTITEVQAIFLDALLAFDGSVAGGTVGNNNVPDIFPTSYSPTTNPGMTPNRLTYQLRTSQSISKPTTEAGWDNDSSTLGTTAGAWYVHEWNLKPTIHASLGNYYGNGNPESIGISGNGINARWRQIKVRLTNIRSFA